MGNGVLRRYRTQPEANHDSWRKPKAKSAAKEKAPAAADGNQVAQTWLRAGVKSVSATSAPGAASAAGKSSGAHGSTATAAQDDDDDLAGFSNLADAANKVWDDLMSRQNSVKGKQEMNALFGLSELKDAVERSVKRVEVLQRQVDSMSSKVQQHESSLEDLRRKFEANPAPPAGQWKLGDMAIRRGKGFCELSMVQLDVHPPFFEVRMSTTGSIVGTEAEKLLALSVQQQNTAKATLKDHEQAKQAWSNAEESLVQAQEELRQQHQSLTEQVETKLKEPLAPKGLPDFNYLQKSEAAHAKAPESAVYPEVKGIKEDLRSRSKAREEPRESRPDAAQSSSTANTTLPRPSGLSGPAGFPSFEDLSRMQKEAEKQKTEASKPSSYPAAHATREVFNRPEANLDKSHGPSAADFKDSTTRSTTRDAPFVPAGMPGIPTGGAASGAASKASLGQQRAQQEEFLHQQKAQLQREEAQRQQQQEAQRQREEAERQKQEDWQKQSKQEQRQEPTAQAQAPSQPQTEWVRYKTPDGQVYYHNETTNHTSWSLPPGVTAREPSAAGAGTGQQGTTQSQEDPFADLRKQEEENDKQKEQWQQWYQQYTQWYSQQAGAGSGTSGAQQQQQQQQQHQQQQQQQQTYVPPKGPAPPKLDAKFEDHALYQIKSSVLKEMESMVNEGMEVAKRKKALRFLQLRWHPDKNPDKLEIANSIFQFIEETKPWFLHDPNAEGS